MKNHSYLQGFVLATSLYIVVMAPPLVCYFVTAREVFEMSQQLERIEQVIESQKD